MFWRKIPAAADILRAPNQPPRPASKPKPARPASPVEGAENAEGEEQRRSWGDRSEGIGVKGSVDTPRLLGGERASRSGREGALQNAMSRVPAGDGVQLWERQDEGNPFSPSTSPKRSLPLHSRPPPVHRAPAPYRGAVRAAVRPEEAPHASLAQQTTGRRSLEHEETADVADQDDLPPHPGPLPRRSHPPPIHHSSYQNSPPLPRPHILPPHRTPSLPLHRAPFPPSRHVAFRPSPSVAEGDFDHDPPVNVRRSTLTLGEGTQIVNSRGVSGRRETYLDPTFVPPTAFETLRHEFVLPPFPAPYHRHNSLNYLPPPPPSLPSVQSLPPPASTVSTSSHSSQSTTSSATTSHSSSSIRPPSLFQNPFHHAPHDYRVRRPSHPPSPKLWQRKSPSEKLQLTGLENLGNTCFMNSTMQCLSATSPLANFFLSGEYKSEINKDNKLGTKGHLADATAKLLHSLRHDEASYISPTFFREAVWKYQPQFRGHQQHDAQEFLDYLLDGLHEDLNLVRGRKDAERALSVEAEAELERLPEVVGADREWERYRDLNDSVVIDFFQGLFRNKVECLVCHRTSTSFNAFQTLSLPIPDAESHRSEVHLHHCLEAFLREEILAGENAWNCPRCLRPRPTSKRLSLSRHPQFLVIHLKRFSSTAHGLSEKVDTPVRFPFELELGHHLPPLLPGVQLNHPPEAETTYELYAICNHWGDSKLHPSLNSGHYTAMVRNGETWWHLDDDEVKPLSSHEVLAAQSSAYLLWYHLRQ